MLFGIRKISFARVQRTLNFKPMSKSTAVFAVRWTKQDIRRNMPERAARWLKFDRKTGRDPLREIIVDGTLQFEDDQDSETSKAHENE